VSAPLELRVPDLGDFSDVEVIEVLVRPGDRVEVDTPLITLETDKATMDVPATAAGTILELAVARGSRVSKGTLILTLEAGGATAAGPESAPTEVPAPASRPAGGRPTCRRSSWCWGPARAATRPRSAPPTSGST
jgi:pyruvate/2-oxoglutarate dehydrogenase complex dihydrolipoamide acyltransferase (E2) component